MDNNFIKQIIKKISKFENKIKIIFPEGKNELIQEAAEKLLKEKILIPQLLFDNKANFNKYQGECEALLIENEELKTMTNELFKLRKTKNTLVECQKMMKNTNYQAMMLLHLNKVDGFVGGISCPTGDILRPAFQIIKPSKKYNIVSSGFIMLKGKEILIFGDCSTNIAPNSEQIAEIGFQNYELAKMIGLEPKIAFLSFSTFGSAKHDNAIKMNKASKLFFTKFMAPLNFKQENFVDGEIQFDAAYDPHTRMKKTGKKFYEENANVLIFPNLAAGNISYKIAQRLGEYKAVGPVLLGINKPVNDLSRGANAEEIFNTAVLTAMQVIFENENKLI